MEDFLIVLSLLKPVGTRGGSRTLPLGGHKLLKLARAKRAAKMLGRGLGCGCIWGAVFAYIPLGVVSPGQHSYRLSNF